MGLTIESVGRAASGGALQIKKQAPDNRVLVLYKFSAC